MDREAISLVLAQKLKSLREARGISHQKLSEAIKEKYGISISKGSLMNYEAGEYRSKTGSCIKMELEKLCCLADYYGVSFDYLLIPSNDVRNPDTSAQAIRKCTHFSEKAVDVLSSGFVADDGYRESLDLILSSEGLSNLLQSFVNVQKAVGNAEDQLLYHDGGSVSLDFARDRLLFSVWEASQAMTDICNEIFQIRDIEDKLQSARKEANDGKHSEG